MFIITSLLLAITSALFVFGQRNIEQGNGTAGAILLCLTVMLGVVTGLWTVEAHKKKMLSPPPGMKWSTFLRAELIAFRLLFQARGDSKKAWERFAKERFMMVEGNADLGEVDDIELTSRSMLFTAVLSWLRSPQMAGERKIHPVMVVRRKDGSIGKGSIAEFFLPRKEWNLVHPTMQFEDDLADALEERGIPTEQLPRRFFLESVLPAAIKDEQILEVMLVTEAVALERVCTSDEAQEIVREVQSRGDDHTPDDAVPVLMVHRLSHEGVETWVAHRRLQGVGAQDEHQEGAFGAFMKIEDEMASGRVGIVADRDLLVKACRQLKLNTQEGSAK